MAIKKLLTPDPNVYYEFDPNSKPLGEGGMGYVFFGYRVSNLEGRREVAIKCIKDDLPASAIERAHREASIRLRNDNLVEMLDFIVANEYDLLNQPVTRYYVISELLMGTTLDALLDGKTEDQTGASVPEAVNLLNMYRSNKYLFAQRIITNVLQGLIALHSNGYIHRDIDATNIIVTTSGKIKLIDFGIAKLVTNLSANDRATTSVGEFIGKPIYAAPEQILGDVKHQNQTTDLYSVGAMFYHMLTGQPPFRGSHHEITYGHLHNKIPLSNVPHRASSDIIKKACAKNQASRYQSAIAFLADMEKLRSLPYPDTVSPVIKYSVIACGVLALALVVALIIKFVI